MCQFFKQTYRNSFKQFLLLSIIFFAFQSAVYSITVNSLVELMPYLDDNNVDVKLSPGTYSITADDVANGLYQDSTILIGRHGKVLLLFKGNNSNYDFTDVTLKVKTEVFKAYGKYKVYEIQIIGNNNVLKNLTLVDDGSVHDKPSKGACNIVMDGSHNRVEGFHITIKGSFPYGYGDAFGKGGRNVIRHQKHSAFLIRGESNHAKNCTLIHRSYGHCIFMQAASNPIIEGCYVEGEVRSTDDMLAETSGPAFDVDFKTIWGYKLPAGYMMSLGEAGIRAYNAGETIIDGVEYSRGTSNPKILNCTIKYMRTGVTIAHATGKKYVEGCIAIGCENGFSLGSGDVVNCSADCVYGPVYTSTYERDKNYNADITILPASDPYYNGSRSVAYIGGSGHKITLRGSAEAIEKGLHIKVGGKKGNIRLMNGSMPNQNDFKASNFELNNVTNYPVFLSSKSSNISVNSKGKVTDDGTNNKVSCTDVTESFDWLLGDWKRNNEDAGKETFEIWEKIYDYEYNCLGFTIQNGDTIKQEKIKLIKLNGKWNLEVKVPEEAESIVFEMSSFDNDGFTCENEFLDFPEMIKYWKNGDKINATVSGGDMKIDFEFEKILEN